ncbi:MAG TPA: TauD/TfdA family dioxygenase [Thermoanaerobaculia bacterium]|nr:TauD/TfdA family dioxygenase [Thermoanaerobaculia bacterium]
MTLNRDLPLIVRAEGEPLLDWHARNRDWVEDRLLEHGAILFRGFGIGTQDAFQRAVAALGGTTLSYVDGNSPRSKLGGGVYTSTEYPPEFFISLHNELSYSKRWPSRVFFCCVIAPAEGGETPLADSRAILRELPSDVREQFVQRQVRYIRNLHGGKGLGPSWQKTFETDDRSVVEEFCRDTDSGFRWNDDGSVTIIQIRPATAVHPKTGQEVWFNQADQFHPSTHPPAVYESMMAFYDGREEAMPQTAAFGDGTPMDRAILDEVRRTAGQEMRTFPWQEGDLLMVDNMLVAHGRKPFKGPRKILVSMT